MTYLKTTAILACMFATGCAIQNVPTKRPMQENYQTQLKQPLIIHTPNEQKGIAVTYFAQDSSAAGAQYGLLGALTTTIIDGIANATPASIAQEGANAVGKEIKPEELNTLLLNALDTEYKKQGSIKLNAEQLTGVDTSPKSKIPDGLFITTDYAFSKTGDFLRISADVSLNASDIHYKTPYSFKKNPPKDELTGPIYRNTLTYYSKVLSTPVKSQADIAKEIAAIQDKYKNEKGLLPRPNTIAHNKMTRALKKAKNDYTAKEKFDSVMNQWLADDAKLLHQELHAANRFIATQLARDLSNYQIPSLSGTNTTLHTDIDGRTITLIGSGVAAGQIESYPKELTDIQKAGFGWGNVRVYAEQEKKNAETQQEKSSSHKKGT